MARIARNLLVVAIAPLFAGCDGPQSALRPAGRDAESIARLFWWMVAGASVIWLVVMAVAVFAVFSKRERDPRTVQLFVVGGGALVPVIVLSGLLVSGLGMMPALLDEGPEDGLRIRIVGHQWWWRVTYELPDGTRFETANEIRLAPGRRTPLLLESADVIHSLWVPSLGGKIDLIPGRVNRMGLEPTQTGVFRGACAEYCGTSHARMLFVAVVVEPAELDAWIEAQKAPATEPSSEAAARGAELFASLGCGACHTVRGSGARGVIGPDLTHVGGRLDIGAGVLETGADNFARWLRETDRLKPAVHMPSFDMLSPSDTHALASYLEELK